MQSKKTIMGVIIVLLIGWSVLGAASFGSAEISVREILHIFFNAIYHADAIPSLHERIVMQLRLPRILLAFLAGAGLSLAGSVLQMITRNPLADPYLFGISSGASFGAVVTLTCLTGNSLGIDGFSLTLSLPIGAFVGASLSMLLVLALSNFGINHPLDRMLLAGVATSFMFSAFSSLLLYFSSPQATASVLFWSLGSFAKASWSQLMLPAPIIIGCFAIILTMKRQIMALQAGDETAHTLGVNVPKLRLNMLLLCSLMTAVLVASCGGIGFVGLMIPHIMRILFPQQQSLALTALVGGIFMVWIDVFSRSLLSSQELPVGIITAAIGSVFFLTVLRKKQH